MALTYLNIVNKILTRLNEVNLTTGTFASATGFPALVKEATNSAIFAINNQKFEWPFNFSSSTTTCVAGTSEYSLPVNLKAVDWESFYITRDDALAIPAVARKLENIDFNHYRETRLIRDLQMGTDGRNQPDVVVRVQNATKFILSPIPNQAYTVKFEYWTIPVAMSAHGDTCTVPETYEEVLLNGIMFYTELFRQNFEAAQIYQAMFEKGIADMTRNLIPVALYVRDTRTGGFINSGRGFI